MNSKPDNLDDVLAPTPLPWQAFESEVVDFIHNSIIANELGIAEHQSQVIPGCPLYSKDRQSNIIFDVAIKVFSKLDSENPVLVWLWECKDYPDRRVSVEKVEEFRSKMTQVGAHKGTMVTRLGFQSGAVAFAKSHGIGLMTLNKERVRALALSKNTGIIEWDNIVADYCLDTFGNEDTGLNLETLIAYEFSKWSSSRIAT